MKEQPENCVKCGAEAKLRKTCAKCGERVWVIEHVARPGEAESHYKWGLEVVPCRCADAASAAGKAHRDHLRHEKKKKRITRDTGKVFHPERNSPVTTPEMAKKAAEGLAKGLSIRRAMLQAGFPESTANAGRKRINKMIRAELKTMGRKYIEMGRDLSPEDQEMVVRGMLFENVVLKSDKGVAAAKQLGADKRVAMWQADSQVGLVVLQAPQVPRIDHEVPLTPSEFSEEGKTE